MNVAIVIDFFLGDIVNVEVPFLQFIILEVESLNKKLLIIPIVIISFFGCIILNMIHNSETPLYEIYNFINLIYLLDLMNKGIINSVEVTFIIWFLL